GETEADGAAVGARERTEDRERARIHERADDGLGDLAAHGHWIERESHVDRGANADSLGERPLEARIDQAGACNARSPRVTELVADDLLEAAPGVEADRERAFGGAARIDGSRS